MEIRSELKLSPALTPGLLVDESRGPAVLRNVCLQLRQRDDVGRGSIQRWAPVRLVVHSRSPQQAGRLYSFQQLHHELVDEPMGASVKDALYLDTPLEGQVRWLPGRSLWYPTHLCYYGHNAHVTFGLVHDLDFVGQIDQVMHACMHEFVSMCVLCRS